MDPSIVIALIVAAPPTLVALIGLYIARENRKVAEAGRVAAEKAAADARAAAVKAEAAESEAAQSRAAIIRTEKGVYTLGKRVDGRLEELLRTTEMAAMAAGVAAGIAQERADPQSPRESERRLDGTDGPIEVIGVADPAAEPIRTVSAKGRKL